MTLLNSQIQTIKHHIAQKEDRLDIDITDSEVFEYLSDMSDSEIHAAIFYGSQMDSLNNTNPQFREPRNAGQIASDIIDTHINYPHAYIAFI